MQTCFVKKKEMLANRKCSEKMTGSGDCMNQWVRRGQENWPVRRVGHMGVRTWCVQLSWLGLMDPEVCDPSSGEVCELVWTNWAFQTLQKEADKKQKESSVVLFYKCCWHFGKEISLQCCLCSVCSWCSALRHSLLMFVTAAAEALFFLIFFLLLFPSWNTNHSETYQVSV